MAIAIRRMAMVDEWMKYNCAAGAIPHLSLLLSPDGWYYSVPSVLATAMLRLSEKDYGVYGDLLRMHTCVGVYIARRITWNHPSPFANNNQTCIDWESYWVRRVAGIFQENEQKTRRKKKKNEKPPHFSLNAMTTVCEDENAVVRLKEMMMRRKKKKEGKITENRKIEENTFPFIHSVRQDLIVYYGFDDTLTTVGLHAGNVIPKRLQPAGVSATATALPDGHHQTLMRRKMKMKWNKRKHI